MSARSKPDINVIYTNKALIPELKFTRSKYEPKEITEPPIEVAAVPLATPRPKIKQAPIKSGKGNSQTNKIVNSNVNSRRAYEELICNTFKSNCKDALLIVTKESGFNPNAVSPTKDYGLFQVNCPTWGPFFKEPCEEFKNPEKNVKYAYIIYQRANNTFRPWSTCKFLPKC